MLLQTMDVEPDVIYRNCGISSSVQRARVGSSPREVLFGIPKRDPDSDPGSGIPEGDYRAAELHRGWPSEKPAA